AGWPYAANVKLEAEASATPARGGRDQPSTRLKKIRWKLRHGSSAPSQTRTLASRLSTPH
ncbi:MAG TPA: hypothetical protein DDZ51_04285, partial [Planctomycetaceae bacterium]|nr:hypothetical protein [Planctomycetaceae bacterium]